MYRPEWLSKGAEELLQIDPSADPIDVLIVGSGYGGAVAAARLAQRCDEHGKPLSVVVLERGREYLPRTFPSSFSELPGHVRFSRFDDPAAKGARDGLFDVRIGEDVSVLVANGLGGGSLINAGVAAQPEWDVFDGEWPAALRKDWGGRISAQRDRDYSEARKALEATLATEKLAKHEQFVSFMRELNLRTERASITVDQQRCVECGDCATGCNNGARKTLSTTYLAQARRYGARLYTGATVSHLEKGDREWAVFFGLTTPSRPLEEQPLRKLRARNVILAAGALGSTEILMRSRERCRDLRLSKCLGERFSANGDMISALCGQNKRVNAAPKESTNYRERKVGPTITAIAHSDGTRQERIVIEELAIPAPLRRVFEEVVTTSAMLEALGRPDHDEHLEAQDGTGAVDAAAVAPDFADHCQIFATMGDDGAKGRLELVPGSNESPHAGRVNDGAIRIHWPEAGAAEIYKKQEELLKSRTALGGTYLPNPLWRPLPDAVAGALSGRKPTGLVFSMHPLGGCRMADDIDNGVVDHMGRVFCGTPGAEFHEGLLVLDGSIIPTALGINPLLTITALAERAIELYCRERGWARKDLSQPLPDPKPIEIERRARPRDDKPGGAESPQARIRAREALTTLQFSERMTGVIRSGPGAPAMQAELVLKFKPVDNVPDFLRRPRHRLEVEQGTLRVRQDDSHPWREAPLQGRAEVMVRGPSTPRRRKSEALAAHRRLRLLADVRAELGDLWALLRDRGVAAAWARLRVLYGLWKRHGELATHVGEVRYFLYELDLQAPLFDANGIALPKIIRGRKTFKYAARDPNPWRQLLDLKLTGEQAGREPFDAGSLTVDLAYFFRGFESRLQITNQRDLPASWMDLASLALFVARIVLKIHLWSFRLPDYQKYDPMRDVRRLPGELSGLQMERHIVGYPETPRDAGIFLPLTRYRKNKDEKPKPVLLIHGLGSGGIQFATPRVQPNLAQHLAERGFDVWVAELRTSIALPYSLDQWTLDEVARGDIPRIVDLILQKTTARELDVVAHCIGSAMFCTAVLDGRLQHVSGHSKIRRAVLLQVGPLITLSAGTRLRGLVAAPLRRFLPDAHLDFSVDERAGWVEALIDRVLSTYPYPPGEARHHRLGWSKRRNAHIANCNRWAAIDGRMIQHENVGRTMLDGLGEVLGHASITTWTQTIQYAFLERLTDSDARNSYVTTENLRDYFTFPVRFLHGSENDVFHPLTSLRSQELIERIHGKGAADVEIIDGYSHFDPLIGRHAERDVFSKYVSPFLEAAVTPAVGDKRGTPKHYYVRRPLVGPLLGWLRKANGSWWARIWCRIDDLRSPAKCVVLFDEKGTLFKVVPSPTKGKPGAIDCLDVGPIDTILCVDVDLGVEPMSEQIVVLSVHESMEEPLSAARRDVRRKAESSAGKPQSASRPPLTIPGKWRSLDAALSDPGQLLELRGLAAANADPIGYDPKIDCASVRIPDPAKPDALTFAVASCRYPGWLFDRGRADAVFGELSKIRDPAPSALFLVGDQIYSDATAGAFDPKDHRERFYDAYREAWTAPNAQAVLSSIPVYMMLDDHEAGDNWHPNDFIDDEAKAMRRHGLEAHRRYQWVHSPGNAGQQDPFVPKPGKLYYSFELNGFPVFACDTRSGRSGDCILGAKQYEVLEKWLEAAQRDHGSRPKFVVSPSAVVPLLRSSARYPSRSDAWDGFARQLSRLLGFICTQNIENVVFLCGDAHLSMSSQIWFTQNKQPFGPTAYCIVASPMYAPYPFANSVQAEFVEDNSHEPFRLSDSLDMLYKVSHSSHAAQDSITVVEVGQAAEGKWWLSVRVRGEGGKDLATENFPLGRAAVRQPAEAGSEKVA